MTNVTLQLNIIWVCGFSSSAHLAAAAIFHSLNSHCKYDIIQKHNMVSQKKGACQLSMHIQKPRMSTDKALKTVGYSIIAIFTIFIIAFSWMRLYYGTEISDEAFYIAEARLISQGAIPFDEIWSLSVGSNMLFSWIISLFESITGGTVGLFLFMRQAYFLIKLLILAFCFFILKKHIKPWPILLAGFLTFIPFSPYHLNILSYNTIPILSAFIVSACLISAFCVLNYKRSLLLCFAAGIFMACLVLSHPDFIVLAILMAGIIFILEMHGNRRFGRALAYIAGGLLTAAGFLLSIFIRGGRISSIINMLTHGINNPLIGADTLSISDRFAGLQNYFRNLPLLALIVIILFCFFFAICYLLVRKNTPLNTLAFKALIKTSYVFALPLGSIIFGIIYFLRYFESPKAFENQMGLIFAFISLALFWIIRREVKVAKFVMLFFGGIFVSLVVISGSSTSGLFTKGFYHLWALFTPALLFIYWSVRQAVMEIQPLIVKDESRASYKNASVLAGTLSMLIAFVVSLLISIASYQYVYRDEPIGLLTTKVEEGLYTGIYTTQERKHGLEELERFLRKETDSSTHVMFLDKAPMAYLMVDAKACTPSTWNLLYYVNGINDDTIIKDYFKYIENIPDKIIYIETTQGQILSIFDEDYLFNQFVNAHYKITVFEDNAIYPVYVYQKVNEP